jgi:Holliday junction DNA helicase RuvA subunit
VLVLMGDDHASESSTSGHQSEFHLFNIMIPILHPAGVQELIDYGLYGFALSRYAGVWVGVKCVKDNIESTAVVESDLDRIATVIPTDYEMPAGGLNIRAGDPVLTQEARLLDHKRDAIVAFLRANKINQMILSGGPNAKVGIITTGKSYLDARQALEDLGIDEVRANALGLRLYKLGCVWPIEPQGLREFADGLDLIIVIEEKRSLIETQVREDAIRLFGFSSDGERDWFRLLQSVQGVGSKVALAILGIMAPNELTSAIAMQDKAAVARTPGVGPKLAQRIVSELKDKAPQFGSVDPNLARLAGEESTSAPKPVQDAISALVNLGYGRPQAAAAVAASVSALGEDAGTQALIRRGLKELSQ